MKPDETPDISAQSVSLHELFKIVGAAAAIISRRLRAGILLTV
jgi:hypothetical protein